MSVLATIQLYYLLQEGTNTFNLPFVKSKGKQEAIIGH